MSSLVKRSSKRSASRSKQEIKQTKQESKNLSLVTLSRLSAFTGTANAAPDDLTMPADASVAHSAGWTRGKLQENWKLHLNRQERRLADEAHSRSVIAEHVNPEDEHDEEDEEDEGPDEYEQPTPRRPTGPASPHGMAAPVELSSPIQTAPVELSSLYAPAAPVELAAPHAPTAPVELASPHSPVAPVELASPHTHVAPVELPNPQAVISSEKTIPQTHVVAVTEPK